MNFVLDNGALFLGEKKIRVTSETPRRISVLDTIAGVNGKTGDCSIIWKRLREQYKEVRISELFLHVTTSIF